LRIDYDKLHHSEYAPDGRRLSECPRCGRRGTLEHMGPRPSAQVRFNHGGEYREGRLHIDEWCDVSELV
jgi:hypothetical protein